MKNQSRTLIANVGAAEKMTIKDLTSNVEAIEVLKNCEIVYIEGYFLTERYELVKYLVDFCTENRKILAFNISGAYITEVEPENSIYLAERSDYIFGGKREFEALKKIMNYSGNINAFLIELSKKHKSRADTPFGKVVLYTDGANSIFIAYSNGKSMQVDVPKLKSEDIIDTIGAGDGFVSGFFAGLLKKKDLETTISWAIWTAQQVIQHEGTNLPAYISRLEEISS